MIGPKPRRILVVDDSAFVRATHCDRLARRGFETLAACDAEQARTMLAAEQVDAVVSDVEMPGGSGIELCEWVRSQAGSRNLPFVVVSSDDGASAREAARQAGADSFIAKSRAGEELMDALEALLGLRELDH
jgi:CheY-like chemotaxis protein